MIPSFSDNTTAININKTTYHDEFQVLDLKVMYIQKVENSKSIFFFLKSAYESAGTSLVFP